MWPNHRALQLKSQLDRLAGQPVLRFAFAPSRETANLGYFPDDLAAELSTLSAAGFEHVVPSAAPDVMIVTTHGAHLADALWRLRESMPSALLASWHWDNHLAAHENLATATAVDLCFPSHLYAANTPLILTVQTAAAGAVPASANVRVIVNYSADP